MNKVIALIVFCILFTGCDNKKEKENININIDEPKIEEKIEKYKDDNPVKIGFYYKENGSFNRKDEMVTKWIPGLDMPYIAIIFTDEPVIPNTTYAAAFRNYQAKYENIENYKMGFELNFKLITGETIRKTIIQPDDVWEYIDYMQVYFYDDVANEGKSWYSHVEQSQYNENTRFTCFKFTGNDHTDKIDGDIIIKAFTFDGEDDFDSETGFYRGNSYANLTIKKGN